jgi:hypothetical protein
LIPHHRPSRKREGRLLSAAGVADSMPLRGEKHAPCFRPAFRPPSFGPAVIYSAEE